MSALPLFYQDVPFTAGAALALDEDAARHIVQVLRMQAGESLELANGRGDAAQCVITETAKKRCSVRVEAVRSTAAPSPSLHLAIAFTKNAARNEWLLEKATELGVQRFTPLITARTERERFRYDRMQGILVSAMMQSQQYWLPQLDEPTTLEALLGAHSGGQVLLAHCMDHLPRLPLGAALNRGSDVLLLIGPEGDFTEAEVAFATAQGATGISLGNTRLRTETAAMAACAFVHLAQSVGAPQ